MLVCVCNRHPTEIWPHCSSPGSPRLCHGFTEGIATLALMFGTWWAWVFRLHAMRGHPGHPLKAVRTIASEWSAYVLR